MEIDYFKEMTFVIALLFSFYLNTVNTSLNFVMHSLGYNRVERRLTNHLSLVCYYHVQTSPKSSCFNIYELDIEIDRYNTIIMISVEKILSFISIRPRVIELNKKVNENESGKKRKRAAVNSIKIKFTNFFDEYLFFKFLFLQTKVSN